MVEEIVTSKALAGTRVVDLSSGPAAGIATMILADFGASVLNIERPDEDVFHGLASAPMWRRGKNTLALDLDHQDAMARLHELLAGADVLVCNWRPNAMKRAELTFEQLHTRHPHLIFCHITGFGSQGPCAEYPGYEHIVAARSGRMKVFAGIVERPGPVFSALQVGVHACAQTAVAGILAALFERGDDGEGRLVETSMLQGMLAYEQGPMITAQLGERFSEAYKATLGSDEPPMPTLYYHPTQAADGRWIQFGNLLPHLFDNFLIATDLIEITADPDFDAAQLLLTGDKHEAFRERMLKRIQERPAADWMADFIADGGVVAAIYETTQQAVSNPDIVANGHAVAREDGGVQLGPVARLTTTPGIPGPDARPDDELEVTWRSSPRQAPQRPNAGRLPLAGVRVVELATIIAAPLGAAFLADMGADVIKVEPIGGDPYRSFGTGTGSARVNAGKRSLSVDLKSAAGQEIVLGLIIDADVLIHNYRPGVAERLGIGYEQLASINPGLIYLQVNGYGPDGPGALRPSTHPIPGAAMGGAMYQMGERLPETLQDMDGLRLWTRRLMRANEVNPDPNTAAVVTTAAMLGLMARKPDGKGQRILVDMFGANAYANHDDFLAYPGKPSRALADNLGHGLSPTYRLYPCASEQWIFLALVTDRDKNRFVETLHSSGIETPGIDALRAGDNKLSNALTDLFSARDADFWENLLAPTGVGCVRADADMPSEFWLHDEHVAAVGLTAEVEHPSWGRYRRHGPMVRFDGKSHTLHPPPLAGQHNAELLALAGAAPERAAELEAAGVLFREADAP